jgi:hypothetical protein
MYSMRYFLAGVLTKLNQKGIVNKKQIHNDDGFL